MIGTIAPELAGGVARAGKTEKIARSTQARRCCPAPRTLHSGRRRRQCTILLANCTSEPRTLHSGRRRRQYTFLLANCTSETADFNFGSYSVHLGVEWPVCVCVCVCFLSLVIKVWCAKTDQRPRLGTMITRCSVKNILLLIGAF